MRAARVHAFGAIADVTIDAIPQPVPADEQILVRVVCAALNPVDYKIAITGHRGNRQLPLTLGFDAVGVVEAVGRSVTSIAVGDRVCAMADIMEPGTAADYVLVRERNVARVPEGVPDDVAAGLPLAALTALQALDTGGLKAGQSILVHGGVGGVGQFAIQLAKMRGASVYATASTSHLGILDDLGVDHPIDHHATSPSKFAGLVDMVLDTRGGDVATASLHGMKPGSTMVSIVGFSPTPEDTRDDVRVERMLVEPRADELAALVGFVSDGLLRVHIHEASPLEGIVPALQALYEGHTVGKRILNVA